MQEVPRMRRMLLIGAVAAIAMAVQPAWATTSLITNGSFEDGPNPGAFKTLSAGDTSIPGWEVIGGVYPNGDAKGSIDYIGGYWTASDGYRSLDLDGITPGGVQQTFATEPGQEYRVTFDMAGNPEGPPVIKTLLTTANGSRTVFDFQIVGTTTKTNMNWQRKSFDFTATESSVTLTFQSLTDPSGIPGTAGKPGSFGAALDNVAVWAVPEPVTMFGAFMAVSSLGMYIRRRGTVAV